MDTREFLDQHTQHLIAVGICQHKQHLIAMGIWVEGCAFDVNGNWVPPYSWACNKVAETLECVEVFINQRRPGDGEQITKDINAIRNRLLLRLRELSLEQAKPCSACAGLQERLNSSEQQCKKLAALLQRGKLENLRYAEDSSSHSRDKEQMQQRLDAVNQQYAQQAEFLQYVKREKEQHEEESKNCLREKFVLQRKNHEIEIELAKLTERCMQLQRSHESLSAENVRLRGELTDLANKLIPSSAFESDRPPQGSVAASLKMRSNTKSGSFASVVSESASWAVIADQAFEAVRYDISSTQPDEDGASALSVGSSQDHCFMTDAIFMCLSGQSKFFLPANALKKGSRVVADDGQTSLEVMATPVLFEADEVVELIASEAKLKVTSDHRVPMLETLEGVRREVKAAELKVGNFVFVDGLPSELTSVKKIVHDDRIRVLKIAFKPDLPVGVFVCPSMISSKGHKQKQLRRGGMNKRGYTGDEATARVSIPDTAPGEYED